MHHGERQRIEILDRVSRRVMHDAVRPAERQPAYLANVAAGFKGFRQFGETLFPFAENDEIDVRARKRMLREQWPTL